MQNGRAIYRSVSCIALASKLTRSVVSPVASCSLARSPGLKTHSHTANPLAAFSLRSFCRWRDNDCDDSLEIQASKRKVANGAANSNSRIGAFVGPARQVRRAGQVQCCVSVYLLCTIAVSARTCGLKWLHKQQRQAPFMSAGQCKASAQAKLRRRQFTAAFSPQRSECRLACALDSATTLCETIFGPPFE